MAIHEEKAPSQWMTILLLIVAFFLIYPLWKLGLRELFWDEGEYAVIVSEMTKFPPDSRLHGMIVPFFFPLFPLLAKGLTLLGLDIEFSLRLLSLLPLAALTVIVGIVTTRMSGINAGAAAAAVMFTTILSAEKVIEGFPQMLTILLIYSAWLLWFYYGQFGGAWNTAWLLVGLFAGLAFYAGGWTALVYLFVPMMFLKRPFTLWRRLNMPGFFGGMAILLFFILLWLIPRWSPQQEIGFFADKSFPEYLKECAYTGVDILLRLMPWTFFLYAPFCPALIVIDKNPLFSKYLKVLFLIAGLILVINPFSKARDILYILPAFAILTGLNYDIVVRRHGDNLCKLLKLWAVGTLLFNIICDLYEILPIEVLKMLLAKLPLLSQHIAEEELLIAKMPYAQSLVISEICLAMLLTVIALFLAFRKNKIWLIILLLFTSNMLCFWAVIYPYRTVQRTKEKFGLELREAIGTSFYPQMTVYKDASIHGLYPECYYMGAQVRTIQFSKTDELKEKEVFLLSVNPVQPQNSTRIWEKVLSVIYKNQYLYMWKGTLDVQKDSDKNAISEMPFEVKRKNQNSSATTPEAENQKR